MPSNEDVIERLDYLITIAEEIRDLKRKQVLDVTSVVTHTHCDCHVGACHLCGEKSMTIPSPAASPLGPMAEQDAHGARSTSNADTPKVEPGFFCLACHVYHGEAHFHKYGNHTKGAMRDS